MKFTLEFARGINRLWESKEKEKRTGEKNVYTPAAERKPIDLIFAGMR